jgi:4a-hydroxytetrahydrobiopterin dehydratase
MRAYLDQVACVLRPGSVSGADLALRSFANIGSRPGASSQPHSSIRRKKTRRVPNRWAIVAGVSRSRSCPGRAASHGLKPSMCDVTQPLQVRVFQAQVGRVRSTPHGKELQVHIQHRIAQPIRRHCFSRRNHARQHTRHRGASLARNGHPNVGAPVTAPITHISSRYGCSLRRRSADIGARVAGMDMLTAQEISGAELTDWRKLAQGLHARYLVDDFATGARFVVAVGEAGDAFGHYPSVSIGNGHVDLKLASDDAIYRDDEGTEHVLEWVTRQDVDLARRITEVAADHHLKADPTSVSMIELGLDTARSATIAPVWAALLTGDAGSQGRGTPSDEVRDATGRVPHLWFGDVEEHEAPRQRFHVEVYVPREVAEQRIAAAIAVGGTIVDDSDAPSLTVIADQDGNRGVLCVAQSAAVQE